MNDIEYVLHLLNGCVRVYQTKEQINTAIKLCEKYNIYISEIEIRDYRDFDEEWG